MGATGLNKAFARAAWGTCLATLLVAAPAQAQWEGWLNQMNAASSAAKSQQLQAQAEMAHNPAKRWGPITPVPPELAQQAKAFSDTINPPQLRALYWRLYVEGERNATLNYQRIGLAALTQGQFDMAGKAFDAALLRIETIYADNADAEKARSLWTAETAKDFKGEPYERAMAFFYRGLVYAAKGDFQNARAMFKQADYQDTVAAAETYAGDFALMPYMAGWASYCDGDRGLARDYLQQAVKADKRYAGVAVERPVLVLFETGRAPFKYNAGQYGEAMMYAARSQQEYTIEEVCDDEDTNICLASDFMVGADIAFQATTRGGRQVDVILDGKASFKTGAAEVSSAAGTVGLVSAGLAIQTGNKKVAAVAALAALASVMASSASENTRPAADVREWEQLAKTMWLGTGAKPASAKVAMAKLSNNTEHLLLRVVNTPACQLYWGRAVEPVQLSMKDGGPVEPGQHARDGGFRAELRAGGIP
jgi:tetratricopeptide (TPR) repeat protein